MTYVLHYAPDNASLVIRLALETAGIAYRTQLVDRSSEAQSAPAFRKLNPQGQIPALETPQGVLFETGAILAWLTETHEGLGPKPDHPQRGRFLTWLLVIANTLHPALRQSFYPEKFIQERLSRDLRDGLRKEIARVLTLLDAEAGEARVLGTKTPNVLDFYLACCLRWAQIYPPGGPTAPDLSPYPHLGALLERVEALDAVKVAQKVEGLGKTPFTNPGYPTPPEGSAI